MCGQSGGRVGGYVERESLGSGARWLWLSVLGRDMHESLQASVFSSKTGDGRGWAEGGCWGRDKVLDFCSSGWGLGSAVWEDFVTTGGHRKDLGMQGRGRDHPARDQRGCLGALLKETVSKSNIGFTLAPLSTSFALPANRPGSRSRQTSGLAVALAGSQERPVPARSSTLPGELSPHLQTQALCTPPGQIPGFKPPLQGTGEEAGTLWEGQGQGGT